MNDPIIDMSPLVLPSEFDEESECDLEDFRLDLNESFCSSDEEEAEEEILYDIQEDKYQ